MKRILLSRYFSAVLLFPSCGCESNSSPYVRSISNKQQLGSCMDALLNENSSVECVAVDSYVDTASLRKSVLTYVEKHNTLFKPTDQGADIRTDSIVWIDTDDAALKHVVCSMSEVPSYVSGAVLSMPRKIQMSHFDHASKYIKHRDNKHRSRMNIDDNSLWFSDSQQRYRYLTCILYATPENWSSDKDGGALRCYFDTDVLDDAGVTAKEVVDIEPKCGRLLVFESEKVLHEVLPTNRTGRVAITAWLLKFPVNT